MLIRNIFFWFLVIASSVVGVYFGRTFLVFFVFKMTRVARRWTLSSLSESCPYSKIGRTIVLKKEKTEDTPFSIKVPGND